MNNCINDILCGKYALVGIKDFINCPHPESVLFVNDIPGITLKSAAAIANDEQRTGFNLLNEKIVLANKMIFHRFSHIISGHFDFNSFIEAREIKNFKTNIISPATLERGLSIRRWQSEVVKLYIESLYIRVQESGIVTVNIIDGDITTPYSVSLLANVTNEVEIRYKANSEHILITFDQTNFTTFDCNLNSSTGCRSCSKSNKHNIKIKGWDGTKETEGCFGMGVLANVQCFEEPIICQLLPRMSFMIWYQAGINILEEHIASGRINAVVTFTKDQAKNTLEMLKYELAAEEKQFSNSITKFLKNTTGECFACNGIKTNYVIP